MKTRQSCESGIHLRKFLGLLYKMKSMEFGLSEFL